MRQPKCPICESAPEKDYAPFCSKRCADVDLHKWLSESYTVPAVEDDSEGAEHTRDRDTGER